MSTRETIAANCWCPFTRAVWAKPDGDVGWKTTGSPANFNRVLIRPGSEEIEAGKCIGSRCMAWRTVGSHETATTVEVVGLEKKRVTHIHERIGYCGLAGSPGLTDVEMLAEAKP